jgi:pimeloyl-ACP methyl ester carboxylesterase
MPPPAMAAGMAIPPQCSKMVAMKIVRGLSPTFAGQILYRTAGEGPAIMLTHINQQSSALMVELIAALAPKFRVVAIDYPSHGMSDHIDWQPAIEDYARAALEVMDALKITRFHAMGEAVGAATSMALAANHAHRIDKVVLINTPYFTDAAKATTDIADIQRVRPTDATGFPAPRSIEYLLSNDPEHAPMQPTQDWMDRINVAQFQIGRDRWQAMGALASFDTLGTAARVKQPTLMLYGEHFIYGKHRALVSSRIADVPSVIVAGGRFCMTWERASDIAAAATRFLE